MSSAAYGLTRAKLIPDSKAWLRTAEEAVNQHALQLPFLWSEGFLSFTWLVQGPAHFMRQSLALKIGAGLMLARAHSLDGQGKSGAV